MDSLQPLGNKNTTNKSTCPKGNEEDNRRGIQNISRVSCHVACAIQILCHAIPTVRSVLNQLVASEETPERQIRLLCRNQSSQAVLFEELEDFVRIPKPCRKEEYGDNRNEETKNKAWNPQRLYDYLEGVTTSGLVIDPHDIGDASRTLSCLMRLLSHEDSRYGPSWKRILGASVWEGETRQILEGRRLLREEDQSLPKTEELPQGMDGETRSVERRFLQRTKPAATNKPMVCPLVLKFSTKQHTDDPSVSGASNEFSSGGTWSLVSALNEIMKPQRMKGSSYPWESVSPDTYSEQEILCRSYDNCNYNRDSSSSDDESDTGNNSSSDDESESENCSSSDDENDIESNSRDDIDDTNWITSRRLEIKKIPRVWLLHLDRPRISINRLRRSFSLADHNRYFALFDHVHVPKELNTSSIMTSSILSTDERSDISNNRSDEASVEKDQWCLPSMGLSLRGAIVQVVELDGVDENEDEWEGGHSITLLRNDGSKDPPSWLLIDDDRTRTISEERAIRMIGGVSEFNRGDCAKINNDESSDQTNNRIYYAASLLVYSIAGDDSQFHDCEKEWKTLEDDLVSSLKEHETQIAATVALHESYVGKRIKVKWSKGKFYAGTISQYDISTGKHQVTYDDGDVKLYNLAKKTIEWID